MVLRYWRPVDGNILSQILYVPRVRIAGHRRDVLYAFTDKTVEIDGQRCHQGFPFTSFHLSDFPLVQDDAANKLYIKMAHVQEAS